MLVCVCVCVGGIAKNGFDEGNEQHGIDVI